MILLAVVTLLLSLALMIDIVCGPGIRRPLRCRAMSPAYPRYRRCHLRQGHLVKHEARWRDHGITSLMAWDDPPDAHLAAPARNGREVREPPEDRRVPVAEVVRWAERRAIAEVCPLKGDPREAPVVANPPATEEVVSLIGGGVSRVQTEITASTPFAPGSHTTSAGGWVGESTNTVVFHSGVPLSGGGPPPDWIPPAGWLDVTAVGDSGRVYIPGERRDGFSTAAEAVVDCLAQQHAQLNILAARLADLRRRKDGQ